MIFHGGGVRTLSPLWIRASIFWVDALPLREHTEFFLELNQYLAVRSWGGLLNDTKSLQAVISSSRLHSLWTGPEVIKLFPCSTQLSTNFILLINAKMSTIFGILTFISMINTISERFKANNFYICRYFSFYVCSVELGMKKGFIPRALATMLPIILTFSTL